MKIKFYKCQICGKVIAVVENSGTQTICCGQEMQELIPGTTDAVIEKHVPVIKTENNLATVCVGTMPHPMEEKHFIKWIALQTTQGFYLKDLEPGKKPELQFALTKDEKIEKAYAYCNLHNLWASE